MIAEAGLNALRPCAHGWCTAATQPTPALHTCWHALANVVTELPAAHSVCCVETLTTALHAAVEFAGGSVSSGGNEGDPTFPLDLVNAAYVAANNGSMVCCAHLRASACNAAVAMLCFE